MTAPVHCSTSTAGSQTSAARNAASNSACRESQVTPLPPVPLVDVVLLVVPELLVEVVPPLVLPPVPGGLGLGPSTTTLPLQAPIVIASNPDNPIEQARIVLFCITIARLVRSLLAGLTNVAKMTATRVAARKTAPCHC